MKYPKYIVSLSFLASLSIGHATEVETASLEVTESTKSESIAPIEDPVYFTIVNETNHNFPISLVCNLRNFGPDGPNQDFKTEIQKIARCNSISTIKESQCTLWKWMMDSLKAQQPKDCVASSNIKVNFGPFQNNILRSELNTMRIDISTFTPGVTYRIIQTDNVSHLVWPGPSFMVVQDIPFEQVAPCFTIINETDETIPVSLEFTAFPRDNHNQIIREISGGTTCIINNSDCTLFKQIMYSHIQHNKDSMPMITFGWPAPSERCHSLSTPLTLEQFAFNTTYRIIPHQYTGGLGQPVKSFKIMVGDEVH